MGGLKRLSRFKRSYCAAMRLNNLPIIRRLLPIALEGPTFEKDSPARQLDAVTATSSARLEN